MTESPKQFLSTRDAERLTGLSREAWNKLCNRSPGFAIRPAHAWRIPAEHIERVMRGESVAEVAASGQARIPTLAA